MNCSPVSKELPSPIGSGKNGKVELLRFFFCIAVLLFHEQKYILGEASLEHGVHFALFPHGSIGVEFFFVLSGVLMAKSILPADRIPPRPLMSIWAFSPTNTCQSFPSIWSHF